VWAQQEQPNKPRRERPIRPQQEQPAKPQQDQEQMDPEMKAWMDAAVPGEQHKVLDYCIGTWQATVKHFGEEGGEPQTSTAVATNSWELGQRYVKTNFKGEFMGMPFEGIGYAGYDNIQKKYVNVWMDTMSTMIMTETGTYDPVKKTFTWESEFMSPTGSKEKSQSTVQIVDDNKHVMTMQHAKAGGELKKVMEITYDRVKRATPQPRHDDEDEDDDESEE